MGDLVLWLCKLYSGFKKLIEEDYWDFTPMNIYIKSTYIKKSKSDIQEGKWILITKGIECFHFSKEN